MATQSSIPPGRPVIVVGNKNSKRTTAQVRDTQSLFLGLGAAALIGGWLLLRKKRKRR